MLDEHFRMFAEIVRSRFAIAEMQRVAEEAREAAMAIALTDDLTGLPNRMEPFRWFPRCPKKSLFSEA
jgi:predicted signal transduction protein with EAL and GGDEF domain